MKVYCTRPCYPDQNEPHSTEIADVDLLDMVKNRRDMIKCVTCGMPLILNWRYAPVKKLGQGGFGYTFLALDLKFGLDSRRAIKQFRSDTFLSAGQMAKAKKAFEREYKIQDQLRHPQIPRVYEPFDVEVPPYANTDQTVYYYFVQDYIEGEDLQKKLKNRQQQSNSEFSELEAQDVLKQVLGILSYTHGLSTPIIHRDIKPSNIIQASDGTCHLVDFGAVKQVLPVSASSTQTTIIGTPDYAPPEQFDGTVDFSSDLYALAKTCICLLTDSPSSLPPWRTSDLLTKILTKMISLDPQMRYRSVIEVEKQLDGDMMPPETNPSLQTQQIRWKMKAIIGTFAMLTIIAFSRYLYYKAFVPPTKIELIFSPTEKKKLSDIETPAGTFNYGCSTAWTPLINEVKRTIKEPMRSFKLEFKNSPNCKSTGDGLRMLDDDELELGLSSKKSLMVAKNSSVMNKSEIAKSTVVMIVHKNSTIKSVSEDQFKKIRDGYINNWGALSYGNSNINFYATDPAYTERKNPFIVNSSTEGINKISGDPNGVMIVPIQIAAKECGRIKTLSIETRNGTLLNPFQSPCLNNSEAQINIKMIEDLLHNELEEFVSTFEIVFRIDKENSKKAGEALVEILRSNKGQEIIRKAGYLPTLS